MSWIALCCLQQKCNGILCGSDCDILTVAATTLLCTDNNLAIFEKCIDKGNKYIMTSKCLDRGYTIKPIQCYLAYT